MGAEALKNTRADDTAEFREALVDAYKKLDTQDEALEGGAEEVFTEDRLDKLAQLIRKKGLLEPSDFLPNELEKFDPESLVDLKWQPWWRSDTFANAPPAPKKQAAHVCCPENRTLLADTELADAARERSLRHEVLYATTIYACLYRFYLGDLEALIKSECACTIFQDAGPVFDLPRKFKYQSASEWQNEWLGSTRADPRSAREEYRVHTLWAVPAVLYKLALEDAIVIASTRDLHARLMSHLMTLFKYKRTSCAACNQLRLRCRFWLSVVEYHFSGSVENANTFLGSRHVFNTLIDRMPQDGN